MSDWKFTKEEVRERRVLEGSLDLSMMGSWRGSSTEGGKADSLAPNLGCAPACQLSARLGTVEFLLNCGDVVPE